MVPNQYQVDPFTARRLTKKIGEPLPDGALQALYEFEREHSGIAKVFVEAFGDSAESTWIRAMLLIKLGRGEYVDRLSKLAANAERDIACQLDGLRRGRARQVGPLQAMYARSESPHPKPRLLLQWLFGESPSRRW
ncbi:hypothetical protein [Nonomuraea recticatena]|uniref:Uncharacterized protein n=1 Tax=Nonomuraea recticatena TaxID=46178 RepID=A0ABN3TDN8_9ACTN